MASLETPKAPTPAPALELPDYVLSPDAVLKDKAASWRYGKAPDYTNTRKWYEETKSIHHETGSLPDLVSNLVKNWEIEASYKTSVSDWRTIDSDKYTFAINGGPPQSVEHMLKVGTYNAIITPNDYYSPEKSDFASSHKTFKHMMPTFAWEVLEVYSGPPKVAFKWRHWGTMKNDYVGFNDKGEKITAKAHGGPISIQGLTVATVDDALRVQALETWFDPLEMFRQIAPNGIVDRVIHGPVPGKTLADELDEPNTTEVATSEINLTTFTSSVVHEVSKNTDTQIERKFYAEPLKKTPTAPAASICGLNDIEPAFETSTEEKLVFEKKVEDTPGDAAADRGEISLSHKEMGGTSTADCPFLRTRE